MRKWNMELCAGCEEAWGLPVSDVRKQMHHENASDPILSPNNFNLSTFFLMQLSTHVELPNSDPRRVASSMFTICRRGKTERMSTLDVGSKQISSNILHLSWRPRAPTSSSIITRSLITSSLLPPSVPSSKEKDENSDLLHSLCMVGQNKRGSKHNEQKGGHVG